MRKIDKINHKIMVTIDVPSSKSVTHRLIILSALSNGVSEIKNPLICDDTITTINCLSALGVNIQTIENNTITIDPLSMGHTPNANVSLNFAESGTTARLMTAVCSVIAYSKDIDINIDAHGRYALNKRPMKQIVETLQKIGANIKYDRENGYLPLTIKSFDKQITNKVDIKADISSQYISALLIIAPLMKRGLTMNLLGQQIVSKPYIDLTIDLMKKFGIKVNKINDYQYSVANQSYKPMNLTCEGDYSSASYMLEAITLIGGEMTLIGLEESTTQGDKKIIEIMKKFGVDITYNNDTVIAYSDGNIKPIRIDLGNNPDLVPAIACICSFADGISKITGIEHLRYKESDRIKAITKNLSKLSVINSYKNGSLTIHGKQDLKVNKEVIINTYADHRIAMSFAVLGIRTGNIVIDNEECVSKSYPNFWKDLKRLV